MTPAWLFVWASADALPGSHTSMPTQAACEAEGYEAVGVDPRYRHSVLMRKSVEPEPEAS